MNLSAVPTCPGYIRDLESIIAEQLPLLKSVENSWQPSDFLPDLSKEDWYESVNALRKQAAGLPDDVLVVLVGNIVTEEALPSYQTWLNRIQIAQDETGTSSDPWATWTRGWTAEENRHGDLLSHYLYLSGRVNYRSFEATTQHLIRNGFDTQSGNDPYRALVYVAFQERATKISHANMAHQAEKYGDHLLSRICTTIASDEARHEEAYKRFFRSVLEKDASAAIIAFADMIERKISMPARLMSDGVDLHLFDHFAIVAQRLGVYTFQDYSEILKHLIDFWDIASITNLSAEAARCQEHLCRLPNQYLAKVDRVRDIISRAPKEPFAWIFDRDA